MRSIRRWRCWRKMCIRKDGVFGGVWLKMFSNLARWSVCHIPNSQANGKKSLCLCGFWRCRFCSLCMLISQHILSKKFQRVRYFGIQATANFKKWDEVIARAAGDLVDTTVTYVKWIFYCELCEEVAKRNHLKCKFCGAGMELLRQSNATGLSFNIIMGINSAYTSRA